MNAGYLDLLVHHQVRMAELEERIERDRVARERAEQHSPETEPSERRGTKSRRDA
ncbi:hypothetical protein [Sanguibacter antarcticus]|nr:hypothetical protein [Sanguibacter antarcticus]